MKKLMMIGAAFAAVGLSACGGTDTPAATGFPQPAGTVAVNFTVDDSLNKSFTAGQLQWKGAMIYDTSTRKITADSTWGGPFATLYDDGPWTAGGHEPSGASAGDGKWGITVFATPPATGKDTYSYGLQDSGQTKGSVLVAPNGWLWQGSNGSFDVATGATAAVTAPGIAFGAFGTTDVKIVVNTGALGTGTWDKTYVTIKGNFITWSRILLKDDGANGDDTAGDGKFTFVLSSYVGAGKVLSQYGLVKSGSNPEFIFNFGSGDGIEYKDTGGTAQTAGITAFTRVGTAAFAATTVAVNSANKNTYVVIP